MSEIAPTEPYFTEVTIQVKAPSSSFATNIPTKISHISINSDARSFFEVVVTLYF